MKRDIYYSEFEYRMNPDEYCRYHFENLSRKGRNSYVSVRELTDRFKKIGDKEERGIVWDKYKAYCFLHLFLPPLVICGDTFQQA